MAKSFQDLSQLCSKILEKDLIKIPMAVQPQGSKILIFLDIVNKKKRSQLRLKFLPAISDVSHL